MAAAPVPPVASASGTPEPAPLSEGARLIDTFIAPSKTFTDLRRNASWWAPFLLLAVITLAFVYVVDQKIGFAKTTENQMRMSPKAAERLDKLPPDQRAQTMASQAKVSGYISYGFPVIMLIWYLLVAGVLLATFKFGFSADLNFKTTLAVVVYASLPGLLKGLLVIASILAGASTDSFTFQNPAATNIGYFLDPANSQFLYSVASAVDIFMIWTLALTAIGLSCVSRVKRSTAMVVVFGWYVIFTLAGAGIGAAFS
jgi:hypothetical protein